MRKYKFVSKKEIAELNLDEEEAQGLEDFRAGNFKWVDNFEESRQMAKAAAENFFKKRNASDTGSDIQNAA